MIAVLEPKQNEISVIAQNIDTGLQAFEKRKSELTELKSQATGLKIESIDDKDSIHQVSIIRKKLKSARVEIEKEGKSMRDPLTRFSKLISEKEKELVAIIEPTEKELLVQEKWVDDEKEKIKKSAIDARMEKLSFSGIAFDPVYIGSLDDTAFNLILNNTKLEYEKDKAAKAESERLAKEEAARLKAEREELEKLRAEQAKAQAIIEENNERIRKEQEEKEKAILEEKNRLLQQKKESRISRLFNLGMHESSNFYSYNFNKECMMDKSDIDSMDGETFDKTISTLVKNIKTAKDKEESDKQEAINKAVETARLKAIDDTRIETENKERELQEAKAKEQREAALRPDKEKLETFANRIGSIIDFEVSDDKAQLILSSASVMLGEAKTYILNKIKEL